jgi:hypothetical protein
MAGPHAIHVSVHTFIRSGSFILVYRLLQSNKTLPAGGPATTDSRTRPCPANAFGKLPAAMVQRIEATNHSEQLDTWLEELITARQLANVGIPVERTIQAGDRETPETLCERRAAARAVGPLWAVCRRVRPGEH